MKTHNRRAFLRTCGLGLGAGLLAPFLSQFALRASPGARAPKRLVLVLHTNGLEPGCLLSPTVMNQIDANIGLARRFSSSYGSSVQAIENAALSSAPTLSALGDLEQKATAIFGLSSKITAGGNNHTSGYGALTCAQDSSLPSQASFDTFIGSFLKAHQGAKPFDVLRLGVEQSAKVGYSTCAFAKSKPAPIIYSPSDALSMTFGAFARGAGGERYRMHREVLELALEDAKRAESAFVGRTLEREKLYGYVQSLQTLIDRQDDVQQRACEIVRGASAVGLSEIDDPTQVITKEGCEASSADPAASFYHSPHPLERLQAQFDIATASLIGGLTDVVVLSSGSGGGLGQTYTSLPTDLYPKGEVVNRHEVCHKAGDGKDHNAHSAIVHAITRRHVDMVAHMARTLDAIPEAMAEGSMLDHTAILLMSDNGSAHHDFGGEWPALLLGGSQLDLKTRGQTLVYPNSGSADKRVSNLFVTLGRSMGIEQVEDSRDKSAMVDFEQFGQERLDGNEVGPLSELFEG